MMRMKLKNMEQLAFLSIMKGSTYRLSQIEYFVNLLQLQKRSADDVVIY